MIYVFLSLVCRETFSQVWASCELERQQARQEHQPHSHLLRHLKPPLLQSNTTQKAHLPDLDLTTLDNFLSQCTSEDNAAFDKLLEKSNTEKRRKYEWLFMAHKQHNDRLRLEQSRGVEDTQKRIEVGRESSGSQKYLGWETTPMNDLMYGPQDSLV